MYPTKKLSEICDIQNGYAFDANLFSDVDWFPIIRIRDLKNSTIQTLYKWDIKENFIVRKWDYLIWMDWEFRCYEWNNSDALLNQRVCRIIKYHESILPKFLFYWINKYLKEIEEVTPFVTVKHISSRQIKDIWFPLPPIATQSRIVARLDATFASIDEQISLLRANIADVENMRKSVLKESFQSGEYEEVYLGNKEFIEIIDGDRWANYPKKTEFTESGFCLFLNTSNVRQWFFDFSKMDFITEEKYNKMGKWKVYKNDVILTTRWTIGNSAFVEDNFPYDYIRINSGMVILRNNLQKVSPKYIIHFINSPLFESQKQTFVSGSAQPQLPITVIKQIYIPLPPLPRQHEIVAHLDRVFATTEALRAEYEAHIRDLETLRQSLLEEAFAGRLVPENEA